MKFLLDNNLSLVLARSLHPLAEREGWSVSHLRDGFDPRTPDVQWITQLGQEGGWSVISADIHLLKRPHERSALKAGKVTVFALRQQWIQLGFWDQGWMLTRWLPKLATSASAQPTGSLFMVPARHIPVQLFPE